MELEEVQNDGLTIDGAGRSNIDSVSQIASEAIMEVIKKKVENGQTAPIVRLSFRNRLISQN